MNKLQNTFKNFLNTVQQTFYVLTDTSTDSIINRQTINPPSHALGVIRRAGNQQQTTHYPHSFPPFPLDMKNDRVFIKL